MGRQSLTHGGEGIICFQKEILRELEALAVDRPPVFRCGEYPGWALFFSLMELLLDAPTQGATASKLTVCIYAVVNLIIYRVPCALICLFFPFVLPHSAVEKTIGRVRRVLYGGC